MTDFLKYFKAALMNIFKFTVGLHSYNVKVVVCNDEPTENYHLTLLFNNNNNGNNNNNNNKNNNNNNNNKQKISAAEILKVTQAGGSCVRSPSS